MPRIFVVNAGGFAEPGGGVIQKTDGRVDKEGISKNSENEDGLTEAIMCSLFGVIPNEAGYHLSSNLARAWLKGFIDANFTAAKTAFGKTADDDLYSLTNEEKVKKVGDFFFAHNGPKIPSADEKEKPDVTILTVAAPNFNNSDSSNQSLAFKAGKVEYKASYNNDIAGSITQSYQNIFEHFTNNAAKGDKLYLYDIGTSIFSPNDKFNYKYKGQQYEGGKGYEKFVQEIEKEVFLKYRDLIKKKDLVVCSRCLSKLGDELKGGAIERGKKIDYYSFKKPTAKIDMGAKKAVTRLKRPIDQLTDISMIQHDTDAVVKILNARRFEIDGQEVNLDKNVGKSEIYQSTKLDEFEGTELDVSKFTLTQKSTAQAIFNNTDTDTKVIIHNFANDKTIGGGPGITKKHDGTFQTVGRCRAKAQEENLCMKSTLFASLSRFAASTGGTLRYGNEFKEQSTSKSIISQGVSFFGTDPTDGEVYIDWSRAGSETKYLDQVKKVDVVTVAAKRYDNKGDENDIVDTVQRVREQLAASAHLARENYRKDKKSHIVMGAFGCGAFNNDPKLIASIYRNFLKRGGEFNKAFPENTTFEFAIPLSKEEHKIVESKAKDEARYPNVPNYLAFNQYFIEQKKHDREDKIEQAINNTKKKSTEEESKKKNQIQFLLDKDIKDVESFMTWNKNSYETLKEDPANEDNLNLFLNPQKKDGTKVFAGWGGILSHEKDNIFNINHVIDGGFAAKIGLKKGDKIEIDLDHNDFKKDKTLFEGEMLEAALINKLRAGKLGGIKKIGCKNIEETIHQKNLENIYKEYREVFVGDENMKYKVYNQKKDSLEHGDRSKLDSIPESTGEIENDLKKRNHMRFAFYDRDIDLLNTALNNKDVIAKREGVDYIIEQKDTEGNTIIEFSAISSIETSPISVFINRENLQQVREEDYPIKILAPYKLDAWHWNIMEIVIDEGKNAVCRRYDTNGRTYKIEDSLLKQIKELGTIEGIDFKNIKHGVEEKFCDNLQKDVNCGLASALIMHALKTNNDDAKIKLNNYATKSDKELRDEISTIVDRHFNGTGKHNFCKPIDESTFVKTPSSSPSSPSSPPSSPTPDRSGAGR